ncbi:MAG: site-2 protease family protein, partial [Mycobacteriales bacterium]
ISRIARGPRRWFSDSRGIPSGRVAGVPIFVSPSLIFAGVILLFGYASVAEQQLPNLSGAAAYGAALATVLLLTLSVLAHELAHTLTARRYGVPVEAMTLWVLGGYTEMRREPPGPWADLAIAASGPAVSGLLGATSAAVAAAGVTPDWAAELCRHLALTNLTIAVFNLLPGLPLDGGAIVRAVAWRFSGDQLRSTVIAARCGQALAVILLGLSLGLMHSNSDINGAVLLLILVIPFFLWISASHAVRRGQIGQRLRGLTARQLARPAELVSSSSSLAEALRGRSSGRPFVVHGGGTVIGVVPEVAIAATPPHRHKQLAMGQLARGFDSAAILAAGIAGPQLLWVAG